MGIGSSGAPPLSAAQILARMITVDGVGSTLDADFVRGVAPGGATSRQAKTGTYNIATTDRGTIIDCTSGTFSVTMTAAATLGAGFNCWVYNSGSGTITLDPNSSETIRTPSGSGTTTTLAQGAGCFLMCDGSGWLTVSTASAGGGGYSPVGTTGSIDLTSPVSITTTANITSTGANKSHIVTGTSANYTITIDTSSGWVAGDQVLIEISTAVTKVITISASASIDGSTTRIMHAGECCTLHWTGSTFRKIAGKTIPYFCKIVNTSLQSIPDGTVTLLTLGTAQIDPHLLADTANNRILINRTGNYSVTAKSGIDNFFGTSVATYIEFAINSNGTQLDSSINSCAATDLWCGAECSIKEAFSAGGNVSISISQTSGGAKDTSKGLYGHYYASLAIEEIPNW